MLIDVMATKLTQKLVDKNIIEFDDCDIYLFGLQLMISGILKFTGFMFIAWSLGWVLESLVFLTAFSVIRVYSGGYHANSYLKCFLLTSFMMVVGIWTIKASLFGSSIIYAIIFLAAASLFVLAYAPVDSPNRRLSPGEWKLNRKGSLVALVLEICMILLSYFLNHHLLVFCNIAAISILFESVTLSPAFAEKQ